MDKIIEACREKSIELLKANTVEEGILACRPAGRAGKRNYDSVFARDAAISSLGMILSGDKDLIAAVRKSILLLAGHQAENGQIPNFVRVEPRRVDFWRFDCIDSTLWWLVSLYFYDRHSGQKKLSSALEKVTAKALGWLFCREHPEDGLLVQSEASDWADIMPRSGKVLYSNALWYLVKKAYSARGAEKTKKSFNIMFNPHDAETKEVPRCQLSTYSRSRKKKRDYYLSFANYLYWGNDIDVFGNSLALLSGLADDEFAERTANCILKKKKSKFPVPALFNPIKKEDALWRPYMNSHGQNKPDQYHNGGIWPFISCFWAAALAKIGFAEEAGMELSRAAGFNRLGSWRFKEWFHAETGRPMGMDYQSWNAGAFLWAEYCLKNSEQIF